MKPLVELRIKQHADQFTDDGRWRGESPVTPEVDRLFSAILKDSTPAGDMAVAYLLSVYLGEDKGEGLVCEVANRGRRMAQLVRSVQECPLLTGLEPLPPGVRGSGVLPEDALEALNSGPCEYERGGE